MSEKMNRDGESKEKNKNGDTDPKKDNSTTISPNTIVLNIDMHCEGCANKIIKRVRAFGGVETARAELNESRLTVTGFVDPTNVRDRLAEKTKMNVDLVSPLPKKMDTNNNNKKKNNDDSKYKTNTKDSCKKSDENSKKNKPKEDKKREELPVTTAVLKVEFHCEGCWQKIQKIVHKTKGVHGMKLDKEKETVTITGTMDVKALVQRLTRKLKRNVELVQPKKDKEVGGPKEGGNADGGDGKKKKGSGGVGGEGGGSKLGGGGDGGAKLVEGNKTELMQPPLLGGVGYQYGYGPVYLEHLQSPEMFSDENSYACSIM